MPFIKNHQYLLASGILCLSLTFACSTDPSSQEQAPKDTEAADSTTQEQAVIEDEPDTEQQASSESRVIEWNEFEQAIIEGTEPNFYIAETDKGFDYIKTDFDGDGIDDAIALLTFEGGPENYDDDTFTAIIYLLGNEDGELNQIESSGNLGGESIQYKDAKKLNWNDGVLTYTHQSMRNHIEVEVIFDNLDAFLKKTTICYYSDSGCKDLYVASEQQEAIKLNKLNVAFLDSIM